MCWKDELTDTARNAGGEETRIKRRNLIWWCFTSLQVGHYSSIMVEPTTNISLQQRKSRKEGSESDMVLLYSYVLHIIAYATLQYKHCRQKKSLLSKFFTPFRDVQSLQKNSRTRRHLKKGWHHGSISDTFF